MPVGGSGRIVIEIDKALKRRLYAALALEESTMKDWFRASVEAFLSKDTAMEAYTSNTSHQKKRSINEFHGK